MPDRIKLFLPLFIFLAIAVVFLTLQQRRATGDYDPSALPSALLGKPLPPFELPLLADENAIRHTADIGEGRPFILNVWATWCIACRAEHAYLNQLAASDIKIIGLNYKDQREEAGRWLEQLGNPYQFNLFDADGQFGLELGVYGAPESYVIDAKGIVRYRHVGVLDQRAWDKHILPLDINW